MAEAAVMLAMKSTRFGGRRSSQQEEWGDASAPFDDDACEPMQRRPPSGGHRRSIRSMPGAEPSMGAPIMSALSLPPMDDRTQDGMHRPEQMLRFILEEKKVQDEGHDFSELKNSVRSLATSRVLKRSRLVRRSRPRRAFLVWLDSLLPIVLPTQRIRRYWDFLIVFFVVYNAIQVPLEASFTTLKSDVQKIADIIIDVLFALDVFYTFRTAYVDEQGMLVRDGLKIAKRYLATWFPIDLAASLPLEIIVLWFGVSNGNLTYLAMLKTPRLLRLGRLLRFLEKIKNANIFRIIRLMLLMCLVAHWTACVWHLLIVRFDHLLFSIPRSGALDEYLSCFYGSFLLMVGDNVEPANNVERIFCCVMLVLGANMYATIVGNMALLVSTMNATAARHQQRAETIQEAMRYLKVSEPVQHRVSEYYDFLQTFSHPGPDLTEYMRELPMPLRQDLSLELFEGHLQQVELFHGVHSYFLHWLCCDLQMQVFLAGEHVFRHNEVCSTLHICVKGKVAMVTPERVLHAVHRTGDHFGADALITNQPRAHDAVVLANSDIMSLSATALMKNMRKCSESSAAIRSNALELLYNDRTIDGMPPHAQGDSATRRLKGFRAAQHHKSPRPSADADAEPAPRPAPKRPSSSGASGGVVLAPAFEEQDHVVLQRIEKSVRMLVSKVDSLEMRQRTWEQQHPSQRSRESQNGGTSESSTLDSHGADGQRFASLHWLQKATSPDSQGSRRRTRSTKSASQSVKSAAP